ncbi:6367_t:CDS:1, partial [Scutellospora calospora]
EASSVSTSDLSEFQRNLQNIIQEYALNDIFNADETRLFFHMAPNQTLASRPHPD